MWPANNGHLYKLLFSSPLNTSFCFDYKNNLRMGPYLPYHFNLRQPIFMSIAHRI